MLYHGSHNPNLIEEVSMEGIGTGSGCSGFFCCDNPGTVKYYGKNIYRIADSNFTMFDNSDADEEILEQLLSENGIDYDKHRELCLAAIANEDLRGDEREEWVELVEKDIDDAMWFAQSLHIELARRQGFQTVAMNDECGSIVVLREFAKFERVEICPECGEDKNGEDCDCE